uniref:Uncharacterized protein n=1 Tax=Arundo donax TaxID=35708 RepID=A0A0A9BH15_ARUDO
MHVWVFAKKLTNKKVKL